MSDVLDAIRTKYPAYKDVPDDKLIKAVGDKYPQYLDKSKDFSGEYHDTIGTGTEKLGVPSFLNTTPGLGQVAPLKAFTPEMVQKGMTAKALSTSPVPTLPTIQEKPASEGEKTALGMFLQQTPGQGGVTPIQPDKPIGADSVSDTHVAAAREAVNLVLSVPKFLASPAGVMSMPVAAAAPTLTSLGFTAQMAHDLYNQAKDTIKGWDHMSDDQKVVAVEDMVGTGLMAGTLGKHTYEGTREFLRNKKGGGNNAKTVRSDTGQVQKPGGQRQGVQNKGRENIQQPAPAQPEPLGAREGEENKVPLKDRQYVVAHQEETGEFHVGREDDAGVVQPEHTFDNQEDADNAASKANAEVKKMGSTKGSDVEHVLKHIETRGGVSAASLAKSRRWTTKDPVTKENKPDIERARAALQEAEKNGLIARPDENSPYVKAEKTVEGGDQPFSRTAAERDPTEHLDYSPEDLDKYKEMKAKTIPKTLEEFNRPEFQENMRQFEQLRNKYNGNPPRQIVNQKLIEAGKPPMSRTVPSELYKPIGEVLTPEVDSEIKANADALGVGIEHVDTMDHSHPLSQMFLDRGGIATVDFNRRKIILNTRGVIDWLNAEVKDKSLWPEAVRSVLAQERNHLFTTGEQARSFWNSLSSSEQKYFKHLYEKGGEHFTDMSDTMWGYEAINLAMQDIVKMPTAEFLSMSSKRQFTSRTLRVMAKVVAAIRKAISKIPVVGKQAKLAVDTQLAILDNIEQKIKQYNYGRGSTQPLARLKKRAESQEQDKLMLPGSETVKTNLGKARQFEQVAGEGFKFKPTEQVPEGERKGAVESGAAPKPAPMTGQQIQDEGKKTVDKMFTEASQGAATGKHVAPKYSDFEEAMRKKEPGIMPGQLFEAWQDAVSKKLETASDDDIRNLTMAVLVPKTSAVSGIEREEGALGGIKGGGRGDAGVKNRWAAMANSLLTFSHEVEAAKPRQATLFPGIENSTREKKFSERYAQPKIGEPARKRQDPKLKGTIPLPMEIESKESLKNVARAQVKERDLNAEAADRQDKVDERVIKRRRAILVNELFKRIVIPRVETAELHRDRVELGDIRYGGGNLISAVHDFPPDAWKNTKVLGEELLDDSKRHPNDPNTYTKRLTLIQNKSSGKVSLVSTYRRAGEAMLMDPSHPQKFHLPLKQMIGRYRIIQSVLLDEPVQKFRQSWDSLQDYQDDFGRDAKQTNEQHTTSEGVYGMTHKAEPMTAAGQRLTEVTGQDEGVPGSMVEEGASGHLQGPFRSEIEAVTGGGKSSFEQSKYAPMTATEASSLTAHLASELGKAPDSPDDVRLVLDDLKAWRRPNPSVVSAIRKLAAIVEREENLKQRRHIQEARKEGIKIEPSPLSVDYLADKLSQYIYEDKNLEKTVAGAAKAASAPPRATPGIATPPTGRPSSARELAIEPRAPIATGETKPEFIHSPPVPEATANPVLHALLTAPDIEHVDRIASERTPYTPTPHPVEKPDEPENRGLLLKETSPMSRRATSKREVEKAGAEIDKKIKQLAGVLGRSNVVKELRQDRDGIDNLTAIIREGTKLSLRNVVVTGDKEYDQMILESPIAMMATLKRGKNPKSGKEFTFFDPKELDRLVENATVAGLKADNIINDPRTGISDRKAARDWKDAAERLLKIATWTKDRFKEKEVRDMAQAVRGELADQLYREHAGGVNTTDFGESYLPALKEGELYNLNSVTFGSDPVIGGRFSAKKVFRDHYDAIRAGPFIPKSYDTSVTIAHRVGSGMNAVNRNAYIEMAKGVKDSKSGMPVVMSAIPIDPHQATREDTGNKDFYQKGWQPPSPYYDVVDMGRGLNPVAVLKPYARTWSLLFSRSGLENSALGEGAMYFSGMLKHGVVLILDTFHPSRLGQYAAALSKPQEIPGLMKRSFSRKQGAWSALFYRPQDLDLAVQHGLVHPDAAAWAKQKEVIGNELWSRQEILQHGIQHGLNASRIGDALYKDSVEKIPIVGKYLYHGLDEPGIRSEHVPELLRSFNLKTFNGWMFDRLLPSLISETYVRNLVDLHHAHPDVPIDKLARDVITDINTIYGNMGRQGLIANPTVRDLAQVFLLAPMWQEGLVGKEVRTLGRVTGISNLTGRRGLPQFGALGKFMGRGLAAYFVMTQMINLITKGQTTFQNEDHHKLDAWIPTGGGSGVWLSPMSIFGETMHDFIRLYETNHNVWKTTKRVALNKLGPVGRFANVLWTGTSSQGQYLPTTASVLTSAAGEMAPAPISLGVPARYIANKLTGGRVSPLEPGAAWRQFFASAGVKVQAATDQVSNMKNAAMQFVREKNLRPDQSQIQPTNEAGYARLRHAVRIGDFNSASTILTQLRQIHKGSDTPVLQAMSNWSTLPFTGGQETELLWKKEMNDSERAQYAQAVKARQKQYQDFLKWYFAVNAHRGSAK